MTYQDSMIVKEPVLGILSLLLAVVLALTLQEGFAELIKPERSRPVPGVGRQLEGALRSGELEFEQYRERIVIEHPQAIATSPAVSGPALELTAAVRNRTGRVIKGLEMRGIVVDKHGVPVSEQTAVIIPAQQTVIEPNKAIKALLLLEGIRPEATHAGVHLEVTGVIFD